MLRFAVVHPYSGHNYELRYWLAACGIDPERDVEIVIVPPPLMADALGSGAIDGYCVGEPWSTAAALQGYGRIATVKAAIWRSSPEKVLNTSANWAADEPDALAGLLRALCRSAQWCAEPSNRRELAEILSDKAYLGRPAAWMLHGLTGELDAGGGDIRRAEDFFVPFAKAATFPWKSHALWFYSQMVRWGQVQHTPENANTAPRDVSSGSLSQCAHSARRRAAGGQCEGGRGTVVADAGRLGRCQPDPRPGWFLRRNAFRSRQARRVHRRPEGLACPSVQCTNFEPRAPANG